MATPIVLPQLNLASPVVTDFVSTETILPASMTGELVKVQVPIGLSERKIFLYFEIRLAAPGAFVCKGEVLLNLRRRIVGRLPAQLADLTGAPAGTPAQSYFTLLVAGGTPVGDSLSLVLAQPFVVGVTQVTVQPLRINAEVDEVVFGVRALTGATVNGIRAFLGVQSSKY